RFRHYLFDEVDCRSSIVASVMTDLQEMNRLEEIVLVHLFPTAHLSISGEQKFPLPPFQREHEAGVVFGFVDREEIFDITILARLHQLIKRSCINARRRYWRGQ